MTASAEGLRETLDLADWRRRVAGLYAEIRRLSEADVPAALALWRSTREALYREHPSSPLPVDRRAAFRASHFDHDPTLRFEVTVEPGAAADPRPSTAAPIWSSGGGPSPFESAGVPAIDFARAAAVELPVSAGGSMSFRRIGSVSVPFAEGPRRLGVFWMAGYAGGIFIPFRDATNGETTYGAGRYLVDGAKAADLGAAPGPEPSNWALILDFNFAFQPSCAFDPRWACPLAPPENRLEIAIRAGERSDH